MIPRRKKKPAKYAGFAFSLRKKKRGEDRKKLEKELDILFSEYIRLRDKRCQFCIKVFDYNKLYVHHIITRASRAGRWKEENGICLCFSCHKIAHQKYEVFRRWLVMRMGMDSFEKLFIYCNTRIKFTVSDLQMIKMDLKQKIEGLKRC